MDPTKGDRTGIKNVSIQDVALQQQEFPSYDIFADPLFETPQHSSDLKEDVGMKSPSLWSVGICAP